MRTVVCSRCGTYRLEAKACALLKKRIEGRSLANASGYVRENPNILISSEQGVDFLRNLSTPPVAEKARKLLVQLAREYPSPGSEITPAVLGLNSFIAELNQLPNDPFDRDKARDTKAAATLARLSYAWAADEAELRFLLFDYLTDGTGFLSGQKERLERGGYRVTPLKITPAGWEHLQSFGRGDANTAFVAMWFSPDMEDVWTQAIYPGITDAGYSPLRIDKKDHNNKIDDEIIASIRGSHLLVADFSGGRGGVYYEAGFAAGLNKPVIWTVEAEWLEQLHFDTRQFNHIVWNRDKLDIFRNALKNRILATVGQGTSAEEHGSPSLSVRR